MTAKHSNFDENVCSGLKQDNHWIPGRIISLSLLIHQYCWCCGVVPGQRLHVAYQSEDFALNYRMCASLFCCLCLQTYHITLLSVKPEKLQVDP